MSKLQKIDQYWKKQIRNTGGSTSSTAMQPELMTSLIVSNFVP